MQKARISFAKYDSDVASVIMNEKATIEAIEVVSSVKLLGLNIFKDFKWNCHVSEISRKVSTKLYFLKQLKRVNVEIKDQVTFFVTCLRPVTEYACDVFHNSLPNYISDELEHL